MSPTHIVSRFNTYEPMALDAITRFRNASSPVKLWCNEKIAEPDGNLNVTCIRPYAGDFPYDGDLVILGADTMVGHWYRHESFKSVTLIHLDPTQTAFFQAMHLLTQAGTRPVGVIYANRKIKQLIGLNGHILFD